MPTAFDVRALTSIVRIELDDSLSPAEQETIAAQWADLLIDDAETADSPAHTIRGRIGSPLESLDEPAIVVPSAVVLADQITSEVTLTGINRLRGEALMLHAAAISTDDGRVIGFIGPSGRGKTTASRALGTAFGYVTDETLAVRPDGVVVPYPKPLSLGERPGHKHTESASALGLKPATEELRLAALVLLDRQPGIEQPVIESMPLTDVLAELVPQTSFLTELEHPLRTLAETVLAAGGVRRVLYSEADGLPALVEEILAGDGDDGETMLTDITTAERDCDCFNDLLAGELSGAEKRERDAIPGTYRRAPHVDALLVDDHLLVLTPGVVTVLDGVGPIVWLAADNSTEDQLREAALQELPAPPEGVDPALVVAGAIEQLVDAGLLIRS